MNKMTEKPVNMSRILLTNEDKITLEFGFYKDGMVKPDSSDRWHHLDEFGGWLPITEVHKRIKGDENETSCRKSIVNQIKYLLRSYTELDKRMLDLKNEYKSEKNYRKAKEASIKKNSYYRFIKNLNSLLK